LCVAMEHLISDIKAFCEARGMSAGTFGSYAVGDGKFMGRIEKGGQCLPKTVEIVREFMATGITYEQRLAARKASVQPQQGAA